LRTRHITQLPYSPLIYTVYVARPYRNQPLKLSVLLYRLSYRPRGREVFNPVHILPQEWRDGLRAGRINGTRRSASLQLTRLTTNRGANFSFDPIERSTIPRR